LAVDMEHLLTSVNEHLGSIITENFRFHDSWTTINYV